MKKIESNVRKQIVLSDDGCHCYETTYSIEPLVGAKAVLVTIYPSYSSLDPYRQDSTALHIQNHMEQLGLNSVTVINLFSRIVHGSKMSTRGIQIDTENLEYIEKEIFQKPDFQDTIFILGWGTSLSSCLVACQTKDKIISLFKKYNPTGTIHQICSSNSTSSGQLFHPLYLGIRSGNSLWELRTCTLPLTYVPVKKTQSHVKDDNINIQGEKKKRATAKNNSKMKEIKESNTKEKG